MLRTIRVSSFCLALLACCALLSTLSPAAMASAAAVQAIAPVPANHAKPLLTSKIDDSKVAPIPFFGLPATRLAEAQGAKDLGRADAGKVIAMELDLRRGLDQISALTALRNHSQNPNDPMYGKTVTPAEFAAQTGLNSADLAVLQGWLTSKGFTVSGIDNARLTIKFSGSVGDVENAFHTEIHNYQAKDGSIHFGNATTVQMPRALLAAVAKLTGLENFTPFYVKSYGGPVSDFATKGLTALDLNAPKTNLHLSGDPASDFSFTASKASVQLKQPVVLNVRIADASYEPTGSIVIKGDKGVIGGIADISSCAAINGSRGRSCSVEVALPQVGMNRLTAVYSGNNNLRSMRQTLVIPRVGTGASYQAETGLPLNVSATAGTMVYTTVTTWVGNAQAVGNVIVYFYLDYPDFYSGEGIYPAAGATTTSGSGTDSFSQNYTYSCTTSLVVKTVTCTVTEPGAYADIGGYGPYSMEATYSGDANYASSEQDFAEVNAVRRAGAYTPTVTLASTLTNQTYGTGVAEAETTTVTSTNGGNPGGTNASYPGTMVIYDANQLGTPNAYSYNGACTNTSGTAWTCGPYSLTWTNEPILAPGTYTVTFGFTGNVAGAAAALNLGPGSASKTFTVSQQAPTATTTMPTATTQTYGALAAFTVKGKLAWTGSGNAPTQSDITFTSTAAGSLGAITCTNTGSANAPATPYTCTATFTPTATDAAGSYNVNLSFTGDANYSAAAGTLTGNYVITAATQTDSLSAVTAPQGSTAGVSITASSNAEGSLVTFGTAGGVGGSYSPATCTIASGSCSVNYIPSGTLTAGTYTNDLTASFGATTDYSAGSATSTLTITAPPVCSAGQLCFTSVSHNFGQVQVGTAATQYGIQISNHSTTTAYPFTLQFTPSKGFTSANNCGTMIAAGGHCELVFYFTPATTGPVSTTWSLASEGGFTYYPSNGGLLQGSGTSQGGVSVTTAGHNFGTVTPGQTSPTYGVELSNSTTSAVTLTKGSVTAPFAAVTNCGTSLPAGSSCELQFTFTPTSTSTVQQVYTLSAGGVTITAQGNPLPNGGITLTGN